MGRRVHKRMRRRPLDRWAEAVLAAAVSLHGFPVAGADLPIIDAPASLVSHQSRPSAAADKPTPRTLPYPVPALTGNRFPMSEGGVGQPTADYASTFAEPATQMEEHMQAVIRGGNQLVYLPVGAGRFSLVQHGASMGASLRFDGQALQPSIELTGSGTRKIKLAFTLHW
jgi:hypothetical protein